MTSTVAAPDVAAEPEQDPAVSTELEAKVHALLFAGDVAAAADAVEQHWTALVDRNLRLVRIVAEQLPEHELAERPGWREVRRAIAVLQPGPRAGRSAAPAQRHPPSPERTLLRNLNEHTEAAANARLRGEPDLAVEHATAARAMLSAAPARRLAALRDRLPALHLQWGITHVLAGREVEARAELHDAASWAAIAQQGHVVGVAAAELAWLHAFSGRMAPAESWAGRAEHARRSQHPPRKNPLLELTGLILATTRLQPTSARPERPDWSGWGEHSIIAAALSAVARSRTSIASVAEELDRLNGFVAAHPSWVMTARFNRSIVAYARAHLLTALGRPEQALAMIDEAVVEGAGAWALARRAGLRLLLDDLDGAEADAAAQFGALREAPRFLVEAMAVSAAIEARRGRTEAAQSGYAAAIEHAIAHEVPLALTQLPEDDARALGALVREPRHRSMLDAVGAASVPRPARHGASARLSPQEHRVVTAFATTHGGTTAEIAASLALSEHTVKVHLRSIYRKLGVQRRSDMLRVARTFGYL